MPVKEAFVSVRFVAVVTSILLVLSTPARAQSASSAPQSPSAVQSSSMSLDDWTGLYVGANLGHVSGTFGGPVTFGSFTSGGQMIPAELYAAVAQVLAFVYRMAGRRKAAAR